MLIHHTHTHMHTHAHTHPTQSWRELEAQLFERDVAIPVYFAIEDSELKEIHSDLILAAKKEKTATAVEGEGDSKGGRGQLTGKGQRTGYKADATIRPYPY